MCMKLPLPTSLEKGVVLTMGNLVGIKEFESLRGIVRIFLYHPVQYYLLRL